MHDVWQRNARESIEPQPSLPVRVSHTVWPRELQFTACGEAFTPSLGCSSAMSGELNVDSPQVVAPCGVSGQVHPAVSDEGGLTSVHASKPTKLTVSGTTIQGTPIQFHLSGMPNSLAGGSVRRVGTVPVNCISHKYRGSAHSRVSAHQYQVNMSAHQYRGSAHSRVSAHPYHGTKCQFISIAGQNCQPISIRVSPQ